MTGPGYNRRINHSAGVGGEAEAAECPLSHLIPDPAKFRLLTPSKNTLGPDPCWKPQWASQSAFHPCPSCPGVREEVGFLGWINWSPLSTGKTPCLDF